MEGQTHALPQPPHPLHNFVVSACRSCATGATSREEGGGFATNDVEVHLLGDVEAACFLDLQQLTLTHFAHRSGRDFEQVKRLGIDCSEKAPRQEVVADEDGDLLFPERLDAEDPAAKGTFVDHVVVHKGRGVQQFNERRGGVGPVGGAALGIDAAVESRAEEDKHGPHLLALATQDVPHDRVEQGDVGGDGGPEFGLEGRHVSSEEGGHTFQI